MRRYLNSSLLLSSGVYTALLIFIVAFNFSDNPPPSGWYQQFMPNLNGRVIRDIFFLDSLNGWAVTPYVMQYDTTYVLRTTNGGDNWFVQFTQTGQFVGSNRVFFLNANTGYTCGVGGPWPTLTQIQKTTDGGNSWFNINTHDPFVAINDMSVLNEDTMWLVASSGSPAGGVWFTSTGGGSWEHRGSFGSNPDHIYMFNERIGFIGCNVGERYVRKTTNSGLNWLQIVINDYFSDMYFADSLTGWKCSVFGMKKTTDGGLNWVTQVLPSGGIIQTNSIGSFSNIGRDTIWSNGGYVLYPNNRYGFMLNRTTNGGTNWLFQIPDTSFFRGASHVEFTDGLHGWAYGNIHTTTGGDTIFYTAVNQISSKTPNKFQLFQNYPNPFNAKTIIRYSIPINGYVLVRLYDILGRDVSVLVNEYQTAGEYDFDHAGIGISSGIYFYRMEVRNSGYDLVFTDTKKLVLIK